MEITQQDWTRIFSVYMQPPQTTVDVRSVIGGDFDGCIIHITGSGAGVEYTLTKPGIAETWFSIIGMGITGGILSIMAGYFMYGVYLLIKWGVG